jgi:hypothetical protein
MFAFSMMAVVRRHANAGHSKNTSVSLDQPFLIRSSIPEIRSIAIELAQ